MVIAQRIPFATFGCPQLGEKVTAPTNSLPARQPEGPENTITLAPVKIKQLAYRQQMMSEDRHPRWTYTIRGNFMQ